MRSFEADTLVLDYLWVIKIKFNNDVVTCS